jgi:hypothetical protein
MIINIHDNRVITEIQQEFTAQFPYLKLEFFSKPHATGYGTSKRFLKTSVKTIGECRKIHDTGDFIIKPEMTVADLEQQFRDLYGLNVQLFRKSGNLWLETSVTDVWTLQKQNDQGEALSTIFNKTAS